MPTKWYHIQPIRSQKSWATLHYSLLYSIVKNDQAVLLQMLNALITDSKRRSKLVVGRALVSSIQQWILNFQGSVAEVKHYWTSDKMLKRRWYWGSSHVNTNKKRKGYSISKCKQTSIRNETASEKRERHWWNLAFDNPFKKLVFSMRLCES